MTTPIRWPNVTYNDDGSCVFMCTKHGEQPWLGHLVCRDCGAGYTAADSGADSHAPPRCTQCRQRFLPIPGAKRNSHYFSAVPCCTPCYEEAPGGGDIQKHHDKGSSYCKGEECPIHGQMIRKLARRAERAAWAARKSVVVEHVVHVQVPGELGERALVVQEVERR